MGGIYIAGQFDGAVDFDPGNGTYTRTSAGSADGFAWKLTTGGNFVWAGQMGGTGLDRASGIGVDAAGNILVAGYFQGTADLDPGTGTYNVTSNGGRDFFLLKLTQSSTLAASASTAEPVNLLLSTEPIATKRRATLDSAFANLSMQSANDWNNSLDEELLLTLTSI